MRLSPVLTALAAVAALVIAAIIGAQFIQPNRPLLSEAGLVFTSKAPNTVTPQEVATIRYTLNRNASVTIAFTNRTDGKRFLFRNAESRPAGSFQVMFSGVVDGYSLPGDKFNGQIETRLVPNGDYDWTIEAAGENGETARANGTLTIKVEDPSLPDLLDFAVSPQVFTPNQDGIGDRVNINLFVAKDATLTVYLEDKEKRRYYISERIEGRKRGEKGAHYFDYDGGVDNNITPPPDGDYTVVVLAEDKTGQRVRRTSTVKIADSGLPNAEIVAQASGGTVFWANVPYKAEDAARPISVPQGVTSTLAKFTMPQGDLLIFRLTISNYGTTPIRTIGPWPGTIYQYDQKAAALNADAVSGTWRVGLECERSDTTLPWRWAIGAQDQLTKVERDGETLWYLPPGKQAVVWGAVRMTRLVKTRNPQDCWAALIHEDVAIPPLQSHVGAIKVELIEQKVSP